MFGEAIPDPGEDEVEAAIRRLKQRKAAGPDTITAEELQAGTNGVGVKSCIVCVKQCGKRRNYQRSGNDPSLYPYARKKDRLESANYRGISLTCHSGKIFTSIIKEEGRRNTIGGSSKL